jgi:hypothetical protein
MFTKPLRTVAASSFLWLEGSTRSLYCSLYLLGTIVADVQQKIRYLRPPTILDHRRPERNDQSLLCLCLFSWCHILCRFVFYDAQKKCEIRSEASLIAVKTDYKVMIRIMGPVIKSRRCLIWRCVIDALIEENTYSK